MRIAICGGSVLEAQEISEQIKRIDPGKHTIILKTVSEIIQLLITGHHFDLFLCDIDVHATVSPKQVQQLNSVAPHSLIVLISSNSTLFIECSEYIWRYEIKPFTAVKIKYVLARAKSVLSPQMIALPVCGSNDRMILNIHQILYFEIFDKTGVVHTTNNSCFRFRSTLTKIESELVSGTFYKPHKSFLVNIEHIQYITENEILMHGDIRIPLSRNRKHTLFKLLSNYSHIIYT